MLNLDKLGFENIWVTSDWHVNHKNLCAGISTWTDKSGCRDFTNLEDMWAVIRDNTNRLVGPKDLIINLGDLLFGEKFKLPDVLAEITCKNWLYIFGNHCDWLQTPKYKHLQRHFSLGCFDYLEVVINKRLFVLSHYLYRTWRDQAKGSIQLGGHSHASHPDDLNLLSIDVGVDTTLFGHEKYCPYSISELLWIMDTQKTFQGTKDHHKRTDN